MAPRYVAAIDQGTTGTRCLLVDRGGQVVASAYAEHRQIYPRAGWVEHDPLEIWDRTQYVIRAAMGAARVRPGEIAAVGVTNQRETTIVWERKTGRPYANAIVWQDTRTKDLCKQLAAEGGQDRFRSRVGLPISTYFSAPKLQWLMHEVPELRRAAERGEALFGTVDAWLIWWLTGGPDGGVHATDVTNASRTMLLRLDTLSWDEEITSTLGIPVTMLPEVRPSSDPVGYGLTRPDGPFGEAIPVTADLGDQQAALVGQVCFAPGEAKNTYGTGCFLLLNTGERAVPSRSGLLTTVAYRFGDRAAVYALEGSVAIAGALVQWLRDNLGFFRDASEIEALARRVPDNGGIYIVPAFSGLFAPYWRSDARGAIVGLTRYITKEHLCRAALEATAYQTRDVLEAMERDSGVRLSTLKADGGMVKNELLMQFQADLLGVPVVRPRVAETTGVGAAYAAGLAVGFWKDERELRENWAAERRWEPEMRPEDRERLYRGWKKAVERTFGWVEG
ncbi:MAG: glycerol kinase GlpK [Chloroflexia bacterium]